MKLQGRELKRGLSGTDVALLHRALAIVNIIIPENERAGRSFGDGTHEGVMAFQRAHGLEPTGIVESLAIEALNAAIAGSKLDVATYVIKGTVISKRKAALGGLKINVFDKNFGSERDVLLSTTQTDDRGQFNAKFEYGAAAHGKLKPDIQVEARLSDRSLGSSNVRYNASTLEALNIALDEKASSILPTELEALTRHLQVHFGGSLSTLQEGDNRHDFTYLGNKTGWDARAVALASIADDFSKRTASIGASFEVPAPYFYALFRSGIAPDANRVYFTPLNVARDIWNRAIDDGIIPKGPNIDDVVTKFAAAAQKKMLEAPAPPTAISSFNDLLSVSLGSEEELKKKFTAIYLKRTSDSSGFWTDVANELPEHVERLKLDNQLAGWTLFNGPLIDKLHQHHSVGETEALAQKGFYKNEIWRGLIGDDRIPPQLTGPDGVARYSNLLAAQIRVTFPTLVAATMVGNGETLLSNAHGGATGELASAEDILQLKKEVQYHLEAIHKDFDIGVQPIEQFAAQHHAEIPERVVAEIKRIQRVYQISPSNAAMNALLSSNIDSAYAVTRYDRETFIEAFKGKVGSEADASLIYSRAEQVHASVLNIASAYLLARTSPVISGPEQNSNRYYLDPSPARALDPAADPSGVLAYPTLDGLFGEMDYCSCEHCRSILGPAAYLVDILRFMDPDQDTWKAITQKWKADHGGAPYPFLDLVAWNTAGQPAGTEVTPYQIFIKRRGDVPNLLLTCSNTNTGLPYIDLVNETLEFLISQNSLAQYPGHDTDEDTTTEELLASPQAGVGDQNWTTTYAKLVQEFFPPRLPFSRRLENIRRYFGKFDSSIADAMEILRQNDALERPNASADPRTYAWRDILLEELSLSREESRILTDKSLTVRQLYGYPSPPSGEGEIPPNLPNAKVFADRLGISYEDLVALLQTQFINPNARLIPKFERLGVPILRLKQLKESAAVGAAWLALLPQPIPDAAAYGGNIEAWVKNEANFAKLMGLITLTSTSPDSVGDFTKFELRYANPDPNLSKLNSFDFVRLIRFVRIWKKLGWTIGETDRALTMLYPAEQRPSGTDVAQNLFKLDAGFRSFLPRLGMVMRLMKTLELNPQVDLQALLTSFAPIDTYGFDSLYRQMFLSQSFLDRYPAFADNGFGEFLNASATLADNKAALCAAFNLTNAELEQIIAALPSLGAALTLDAISAIFRRGWLARQLKVSVRELLLLLRVSGIDPFTPPDPPDQAVQRGRPGMERLIHFTKQLRTASLQLQDLFYILWNEDLSGKSAPKIRDVLELARTTREKMAAIEDELSTAGAADTATARAKMSLVYRGDAVELFLSLLDDTFGVETPYDHGQAIWNSAAISSASERISYDNIKKRLVFRGLMSDAERSSLAALSGATDAFKAAIAELFSQGQRIVSPILSRYPEFSPLHDAFVFFGRLTTVISYTHTGAMLPQGLIDAGRGRLSYNNVTKQLSHKGVLSEFVYKTLVAVPGISEAVKTATTTLRTENVKATTTFFNDRKIAIDRRPAYLEANDSREQQKSLALAFLLADLVYQRKRQAALQAIEAGAPSVGPIFVRKLLDNIPVLAADPRTHIAGVVTLANGTTLPLQGATDLDYSPAGRKLPADPTGAPISGLWTGFFVPLEAGLYIFEIMADADATVTLSIGGKEIALTKSGNVWTNAQGIQLLGPTWQYQFKLKADKIKATMRVVWKVDTRALGAMPTRFSDKLAALEDVVAVENAGLSAEFFWDATTTGSPGAVRETDALSYPGGDGDKLPLNPLNNANPISARWTGFVEVPQDDSYDFRIETDAAAIVSLTVDGLAREMTSANGVWTTKAPLLLRGRTLQSIALQVEKTKERLRVYWKNQGGGWQTLAPDALHSARAIQHLRATYVRFIKAASLGNSLKLAPNELVYFAVAPDYKLGERGWLNALQADDRLTGEAAAKLFENLGTLLEFVELKDGFSDSEELLVGILQNPVPATQSTDSSLFALTGWDKATLDAMLGRFGQTTAALSQTGVFQRVYRGFKLVKRVGTPLQSLLSVAHNSSENDDRVFLSALRARYRADDWLVLLRSVNDQMRGLQRDAMVSYVLHKMRSDRATERIDTTEKLFEYLLMDVQMEACTQTSRITQAISSVQLFIDRCLMNLEPQVSPSAIKSDQWAWIKRYRLWEANRKIFLYPENWLEPELRDDSSPQFKEAMSELLQSDVTDDRAAAALINYLSKLEELAKLQPCGIYLVENDVGNTNDDVNHVVAKTPGANRKYFYRRREGLTWTPWEQITLDIEGNNVVPMVWKGRLFLFWLRILKQPDPPPTIPGDGNVTGIKINQFQPTISVGARGVLCWSEYCNGKWLPTKTSDVNRPLLLGPYRDDSNVLMTATEERDQTQVQGTLLISVKVDNSPAKALRLYNTHSLPLRENGFDSQLIHERTLGKSGSQFMIQYEELALRKTVFGTSLPEDRAIQPHHKKLFGGWWNAPFFYEDSRHVFYVSTMRETVNIPDTTPPDPPPDTEPCHWGTPTHPCIYAPDTVFALDMRETIAFGNQKIARGGALSELPVIDFGEID